MSSEASPYDSVRKIALGNVVVKCRLGQDIRRIPINQAPTYDELCLMMHRVFKDKLTSPNDIRIKYTDNEGDLINMEDDTDVGHAISLSNLLNITVYDNQPASGIPETTVITNELKFQMVTLRDTLSHLIHSLEQKGPSESPADNVPEKEFRKLSTSEINNFLPPNRNQPPPPAPPPPAQQTPQAQSMYPQVPKEQQPMSQQPPPPQYPQPQYTQPQYTQPNNYPVGPPIQQYRTQTEVSATPNRPPAPIYQPYQSQYNNYTNERSTH